MCTETFMMCGFTLIKKLQLPLMPGLLITSHFVICKMCKFSIIQFDLRVAVVKFFSPCPYISYIYDNIINCLSTKISDRLMVMCSFEQLNLISEERKFQNYIREIFLSSFLY